MAGSSTAIGSAAVILSANADKLTSGLDKAKADVSRWAGGLDSKVAGKAPGKGFLNRMIFGTAEFDADTGKYVGRVGGLVGRVKSLFGGGKGGLLGALVGGDGRGGFLTRSIFGTAQFDQQTGQYMGRVGGVVGRVKALFSPGKGGLLSRLVGGEKGGGGGFLATAIGGFAGGIAGALTAAGISKFFSLLHDLPELTQRLGGKATGSDLGALQSVSQGFVRIQEGVDFLMTKGLALLAPAFGAALDAASAFGEKTGPLFEKVGAALEVIVYTGAELFGEFLSGVADVLNSIEGWARETLGLADTTQGAGDQMFAVLRLVGKGFAYVWDTVKAGAGVVSVVVGYIAEGFGTVIKVVGQAVEQLAKLAEQLPESIRPDWIGKAADAVKGWGDSIDTAGQKMVAWGKGAVMAWGDSSAAVDVWFDKVQGRLAERKKAFENPIPLKPQLAGAFQAGSKEAYSVVAKFQAGGTITGQDIPKQQLKELRDIEHILLDMRNAIIDRGGKFELI
jgi:hypothetical protein